MEYNTAATSPSPYSEFNVLHTPHFEAWIVSEEKEKENENEKEKEEEEEKSRGMLTFPVPTNNGK